jgi:hypothetical protein
MTLSGRLSSSTLLTVDIVARRRPALPINSKEGRRHSPARHAGEMLSLGTHFSPLPTYPPHTPLLRSRPFAPSPSPAPRALCFSQQRRRFAADRSRRPTMAAVISPEGGSGLVHDLGSAAVTASVALALLRFFEELARRGVCEQVSAPELGTCNLTPPVCASVAAHRR